ncbi:MAG: hypothetical protein L3K04_07175, partial [Thermoplasmata archaeon]|nr:hypothetical protein [Thermoplasmata archaeon]
LSGYRPAVGQLTNATAFVPVALPFDPATGVYTPMFSWNLPDLIGFSTSGNGSITNPFRLLHNETGPLDPSFARANDFTYPEFPGLILADTSAYVTVQGLPSFEVWVDPYDASVYSSGLLPSTNELQVQLYNASHVTIEDSSGIGGWFYGPYVQGFPMANLMLWNCSSDLVSSNRFLSTGASMLLYGGSNNTIWGNLFLAALPGNPFFLSSTPGGGNPDADGLTLYSSGNLVYNNYFGDDLAVPASTPTVDIVSGNPVSYNDTWNLSSAAASAIRTVDGHNLSGSILGGPLQGGNYWGNYGWPANPYGRLPYTDSGAITVRGDFLPIVPVALFQVQFSAPQVPTGVGWSVLLNGTFNATTGAGSVDFWTTAGAYVYTVAGVPNLLANQLEAVVTVINAGVVVLLEPPATPTPQYLVTIAESGLPPGTLWSATIASTQFVGIGPVFEIPLDNGSYPVVVHSANYAASGPAGATVNGNPATVEEVFLPLPGTLHVELQPANGTLAVDGVPWTLTAGQVNASIAAGLHEVSASAAGYLSFFTNLSVAPNGSAHLSVNLRSVSGIGGSPGVYHNTTVGPSSALLWTLGIGLVLLAAAVVVAAMLLRRSPPPSHPAPARPPEPWREGGTSPTSTASAPPQP